MTRAYPPAFLAAFLAFLLSGCWLISADVDDFSLKLPDKQFTVDTAQWGVVDPGGCIDLDNCPLPTVSCTTNGNECELAASTLCDPMATCVGQCVSNTCQLVVPFSLFQSVDLAKENSEFLKIDKRARVRVNEIFFAVEENSLNVSSPPLSVWIGPLDATTSNDSLAQKIGVIPAIGSSETNKREIMFTPEAEMIVNGYMTDYLTPFNLIIAGEALIRPGDPIPTGKAVGVVSGTLVADGF